MSAAFHDSSARDPPPSCHPGTRSELIDTITEWGFGTSQHTQHLLWVHGPRGMGKSAVAQTYVELLARKGKLGAALFFSRPNEQDDPHCLFPSLSYQIVTKRKPYGGILNHRIQNDPTLVIKSIREQFQGLLVKPLSQFRAGDVEDFVIITGGLDECGGGPGVHCSILELVAISVRDRTTPFRWAFLSRPETHIAGSLTANDIHSLSHHLEIRVSRDIDDEIALYITVELRKIQLRNRLPDSWLSEPDIRTLVNLSGAFSSMRPRSSVLLASTDYSVLRISYKLCLHLRMVKRRLTWCTSFLNSISSTPSLCSVSLLRSFQGSRTSYWFCPTFVTRT